MEAQAQVMLMLVQQNAKLLQEIEAVRAELAQYKSSPKIAPEKPIEAPVVVETKTIKKKLNVSEKGQAAHKAAGQRVAALNALRKEFIANAQMNGEW
jgi:hypothetical protein